MDVTLSRTFETDVPGIDFGIWGTANDLQGNRLDVVIPISLVDIQEDAQDKANNGDENEMNAVGTQPLRGNKIDSCTVTSGSLARGLSLLGFGKILSDPRRNFFLLYDYIAYKWLF